MIDGPITPISTDLATYTGLLISRKIDCQEITPIDRKKKQPRRGYDVRTRLGCAVDSVLGLREKTSPATQISYRGSDGSDGARSTACIRPLVFVAKHVADDFLHRLSQAA